jgi:hypothetical protein
MKQCVGDQAGVLSGYGTTTGYDLATGLGSVHSLPVARVQFLPSSTPLSTSSPFLVLFYVCHSPFAAPR